MVKFEDYVPLKQVRCPDGKKHVWIDKDKFWECENCGYTENKTTLSWKARECIGSLKAEY